MLKNIKPVKDAIDRLMLQMWRSDIQEPVPGDDIAPREHPSPKLQAMCFAIFVSIF